MAQKRQWSEEEDRLLKFVFQTSKLTKWSHIARKLQEEFGIKGRNGKQCRERYVTHIDSSFARQQWSLQEEQCMVQYHNELGNKWAIIGSKLNGKSDNCVKNHFYALLRQALRKINKIIISQHKKQIKQFKAPILYKIIEVSEERFKLFSQYEKAFIDFSNELKKQLINFSYNDGIGQQEDINYQLGFQLIDKLIEFNSNYKKKLKKDRKNSGQGKDLLTPNRYHKSNKIHSQNEDSDNNSFVNSSETSNVEDISDDEVNRVTIKGKTRKNSANSLVEPHQMIKNRTRSSGNLMKVASQSFNQKSNFKMELEDNENEEQMKKQNSCGDFSKNLGIEGILDGMKILQQQQQFPYLIMATKSSSKYSKRSDIEKEQYHFFEDSEIEMRILPQIQLKGRQSSQAEDFFQ